ncbi:prepilin-type N-terminal cleavage/methylation domain-containing protein [Microbacterium sp.]|uniref:type IV pilus modification PilV family protein n=1 Tax=Microbacterium sp. TaxID=51671 RepID=UPI0028A06517|nr:prepilin-type N-terminal cleavage/methylation domain-containing protein [Microbacterium sp.]
MHRRFSSRNETGFTLIEVTVAISLLLVVALAAGAFAVNALKLGAQQQRMQVAVTVAGERMEQVQRLTASNAQITTLVAGRGATAVTTSFAANAAVQGVAQTYELAGTAGVQTIPITQTVTRSGSDYTSTVLIGSCYQPKAGGACTKRSGKATDALAAATAAADGYTQLVRVIVTVTYTGSCAGGCRYTTATLFDTKGDPTWQSE